MPLLAFAHTKPRLCSFRPWLLCVLVTLGMLTTPATSQADITRAVEAYKQGYKLYFQKKHSLALQYFLLSYQSLPQQKRYDKTRNALNFFIGDCHFVLGQYQKAYVRLQAYVTESEKRTPRPTSQQYKNAQSHLKIIRKKLNLRPITSPRQPPMREPVDSPPPRRLTKAPPITPRPQPTQTTRPHTAGWVIAGLGVATLAGAVIVGILANGQMERAYAIYNAQQSNPQPPAADVTPLAQAALTQGLTANIMYISGGVLTGTGLIMLLTWKVPSQK